MSTTSGTAKAAASPAVGTKSHHDKFVIERTLSAPLARVYAAWADPLAKARWFGGAPGQWELLLRESDFRVGGRERLKGAWQSGVTSDFVCVYHDIVPERRIVYTYDMFMGDRHLSVSVATIEFEAAGAGTRMRVTEQGVFLDDQDDAASRERGTSFLMDALEASLRA
jgi:uncharacterized protein YndB with AHSA1/START domain